ncbi:MAG TPA: hypothetical protein VIG74_07545 [Alphaproteobacteria bacterium]|jgi:hypothetical protein
MNASHQAAAREEYTVYAFEQDSSGRKIPRRWLRKDTHEDVSAALDQAKTLYGTGQYPRVEIRRKYFDTRCNRHVDMTFKTLGRRQRSVMMGFVAGAVGALACGVAAFTVAYFMNHGGSSH